MRARPVTAITLTRSHMLSPSLAPWQATTLAWAHAHGLAGRERINRSDEAGGRARRQRARRRGGGGGGGGVGFGVARLLPARFELSEDLRRCEPRPRPTTAPAQRRALGRWRARRGTAVAHSARCAWLLLEERCARFRVGVAEAAHEPAHCATVGCEGIREVRHAVKSVGAVGGACAAARARPLGRVRASCPCVCSRGVWTGVAGRAAPPRPRGSVK